MKRMNRHISIILCLLCATSMLIACIKDDAGETADIQKGTEAPIDEAQTVKPTEEAVEPMELTLGIWPSENDAAGITLHEGYVKDFASVHPDVNIVPAHYSYSDDSFLTLAKAGALPVVFQTYYSSCSKIIESGYCADITDILKERGWLEEMNPSVKELMSENGRVFGIPCDGYALGLMLNVELFKKAGIVGAEGLPIYPKTWAELAETGKKIKAATGVAGFCLLAKDNAAGWHFANIAWAYGAELVTENSDASYTSNLDSTEAIAAMEYVKSLKWDYDILTPDPTSEDFNTGFKELGSGTAAMYIAANDAVDQPTYINGLPAEDLSLAPLPAGPNGEQYSIFNGTLFMFSKDATKEQINVALDYISIMGKGPVPNSNSYEMDCRYRKENKIPVIYRFPNWVSTDGINQETAIINQYSNVDMRLYQDYYDTIKKEGNLRLEWIGDSMYLELTPVIQAVLSDKNADVAALMKKADENYQKILDDRTNIH